MSQITIQNSFASPTLKAMLSVLLLGSNPTFAENSATKLAKSPLQRQANEPANTPFTKISISHGTTSTSNLAVIADPWDELQRLQEGWDGANAAAVSLDAIGHAKRFAKKSAEVGISFSPFADPDGNVGLESEKPTKTALLIVDANDRYSYVLQDGEEVNRGDNVNASKMQEILALLY